MDVLGQALFDYYHKGSKGKLLINNTYGEPEEMPLEVYFREEDEMPEQELYALHLCSGHVLDIGAGAGSHALWLQGRELEVTALEISALSAAVMQARGVKDIVEQDVYAYSGKKYDTLLLLMNGIGLTGSLEGFSRFLMHARTLLNPGGQLLFDSSNIAYLYVEMGEGDVYLQKEQYYGELAYQYEYDGKKGLWFHWLYVDQEKLQEIAGAAGWQVELLYEDDMDQYLVRLT